MTMIRMKRVRAKRAKLAVNLPVPTMEIIRRAARAADLTPEQLLTGILCLSLDREVAKLRRGSKP